MKINYSTFGEITVKASISDLSTNDKIQLMINLMRQTGILDKLEQLSNFDEIDRIICGN